MKPCQMDWQKLVILEKCILLKRILVISLKIKQNEKPTCLYRNFCVGNTSLAKSSNSVLNCGPPSVSTVFGMPYSENICFMCSTVVAVLTLLSFLKTGNLL